MPTKSKIKIFDDTELRAALDAQYSLASQIVLCKYVLQLAGHILEIANYPYQDNGAIQDGFRINGLWQDGNARMHDVRQAALRIHQLAKECDNEITGTALRTAGHAVATGHMSEHAMVASDYAVKVINLLHPGDMEAVRAERLWQVECLKTETES